MSTLLVDVGNTRIKWGVLRSGRIAELGERRHGGRADVAAAAVRKAVRPKPLQRAFVANVAGPNFETKLRRALSAHCSVEPSFAAVGRQKLGVRCGYRDPTRLGVDRWLAVLAAHKSTGTSALVIDAGTTLTIDAVTADGQHLGGVIIPGMHLMARALRQETSDIGAVPVTRNIRAQTFLGRSTAQAVNMGSALALAGAVDRALLQLEPRLGRRPKVLVTGGDGERLLLKLNAKAELRPILVLEGLAWFAGERLA